MGKIYDANGKKMGLAEICEELLNTMNDSQVITVECAIDDNMVAANGNPRRAFAHAVLDSYKHIDSTSEQGQRVRKLMDNLMNKYQKSAVQPTEMEMDTYQGLVNKIHARANEIREQAEE